MSENSPHVAEKVLRTAIHDNGRKQGVFESMYSKGTLAPEYGPAYAMHVMTSTYGAMFAVALDAISAHDPAKAAELAEVWDRTENDPELAWEYASILGEKIGLDWQAIKDEGRKSWENRNQAAAS